MNNMLNILANSKRFCKFKEATKLGSNADTNHLLFSSYISAAGGCSLLGNQVLSLLLASGYFFAPTSSLQNSDK